jgi:phage minor structural protein
MTEKGSEKYSGFRYEKNLSSITRTTDSSSITTKLYVESNDSSTSSTGLCSIQTAEDNLGKTSYILDFSYYTEKGMLNAEQTQRDIYGIESGDFAFLPRIGAYND